MILSEEPQISAEVMDTLPDGVFGNWQVGSFQNSGRHYQSCWGPPESPSDNEEFSEFCSHDLILHVDGFPKGKDPLHQQGQSRFPNFKKNFRRACETCFGVNGRSPEQSEKFRQPLLGDQGTGIIDTGASKSVIGEKRVNALLSTLKSIHRESVKWQESETVFRFGNNGCLKSVGALLIPFGKRWMKVEVVQGMTPFLLSNSFRHALGADVMVSRSSLRVAGWRSEVKLQRNAKGLFTVRLTDLIEAASLNTNSVETEEVITLASSCNQSQNRGVYCQQQQHQHQQPKVQTSTTSAATSFAAVAQLQVQSRSKSCVDQGVNVAQRCHGDAQHQDDGSSRPFSRSGIHGLGCSAVLDGEVDPSLGFEHRQMPEIKTKMPPGVMTLREWGQLTFPEGKWKKHTFYQTYMEEHKKLVSPWALSFQSYVVAMQKMEEECSESFYREYARQWMNTMSAQEVPTVQKGPEWELLADASPTNGRSSKANQKRPMEYDVSKMSTDVENMDEKLTRMAILQRELDKIKQEMNQG